MDTKTLLEVKKKLRKYENLLVKKGIDENIAEVARVVSAIMSGVQEILDAMVEESTRT